MALDFHTAKTRGEAPTTKRIASIEESAHEALFAWLPESEVRKPTLQKLSDFYRDAQFTPDEARLLASNLRALVAFTPPADVATTIRTLASAADVAVSSNLWLFAFAD